MKKGVKKDTFRKAGEFMAGLKCMKEDEFYGSITITYTAIVGEKPQKNRESYYYDAKDRRRIKESYRGVEDSRKYRNSWGADEWGAWIRSLYLADSSYRPGKTEIESIVVELRYMLETITIKTEDLERIYSIEAKKVFEHIPEDFSPDGFNDIKEYLKERQTPYVPEEDVKDYYYSLIYSDDGEQQEL